MGLRKALLRLKRDESGAFAVEFAIVFPALLLIIFGTYATGRVFYDQHRLSYIIAEGSRLVLLDAAASTSDLQQQIQAIANSDFPSGATVSVTNESQGGVNFLRLTVNYTHQTGLALFGWDAINLQSSMKTVAPSEWDIN